MRTSIFRLIASIALVAMSASAATAQSATLYSAMHWRQIGPTRAGRARALAGVRSQPNVFYIGYNDSGVWRSTDFGSNWEPIFDQQGTGSIGAIAVAPSDPKIIYVGTGAGIIRPDLAIGDGMYKSNRRRQDMGPSRPPRHANVADIEVDPTNPDRLFRRGTWPPL